MHAGAQASPETVAPGAMPVLAGRAIAQAAEVMDACAGEIAEALRLDIAAAQVLQDTGMDEETVAAAALPAAIRQLGWDDAAVSERFSPSVADLVVGVRRALAIGSVTPSAAARAHRERDEEERLEARRKMLLALARDARVVAIVLARRVALMRELPGWTDADARREVARETMDMFAPLANRLGVWPLKWELEDQAFRWTEPQLYKQIARLLDEKRTDRERYIAELTARLQVEVKAAGVDAQVTGRPKHIYSIFKKMQRKSRGFDALYDVRAVRVLVPEVRDCYTVLGLVHDLWQPISGEFDDYIAHPKGNYYRSLHTAVIGPEGKPVEVQIRTFDMHRDSELGIAAHWRYKEGVKAADRRFEERLAWLRQMLGWRDDLAVAGTLESAPPGEESVYVLTPQGQVIDLPAGSTPVDFAYHVHTDLGHRCRGAKIDGSIVPLTYRLRNAERVEIIAAKQGGPSRDWLNPEHGYLRSPRALAKVRQWFKQQHLEEDIAHGRAIFEREMRSLGVSGQNHEKLAQKLRFARTDELFVALARGEITSRQLETAVDRPVDEADDQTAIETRLPQRVGDGPGVSVLGVGNIASTLARCCRPLRPEPIVGFVTSGRGVSIHRADCAELRHLRPEQRDRLLQASWGEGDGLVCTAEIVVTAVDRRGLLRDVSEVMAREKINVTAVNTLSRADQANMQFTCEVEDLAQVGRLVQALRSVPGVMAARRKT